MTDQEMNHLLIVNTSLEDQAVYKRYISNSFNHEMHVKIIVQGSHAIDFLKTNQVDCIIVDYQLPDMTGLEFLNRLKNDETISVPVIMLTGSGNEKIAIEALKTGAYDYLNKTDLKPEILHDSIANAIEKSSLLKKEKARETEIRYLAYHDFLTGVPNRAQFELHLNNIFESAKRYKHSFAILFIDLDGFKYVNDNYGHDVGDELLKQVTHLFQNCLRKSDILARLGGDEFAVIATQIEDSDNVTVIANKLISSLATTLTIHNHKISISASIGISIYPGSGEVISQLLSQADLALYKAKNCGKNSFCYFTDDLTIQSHQRMKIENALYEMLEKQDFTLCYQPVIQIAKNQFSGLELSFYPNHPELKKLPINAIIELTSKAGLMPKLGTLILEKALQQRSSWLKSDLNPCKLSLSISISQLIDENWISSLESLISDYQINPEDLRFELQESDLIFNFNDLDDQIDLLIGLGCELMINNFGVGYSSLNLIRQLPLTGVKLDKTFIANLETNLNNAKVISAINSLVSALGLSLIATGVETQAQFNILKNHPELFGQGLFFCEPMTEDKCREYLVNQSSLILKA